MASLTTNEPSLHSFLTLSTDDSEEFIVLNNPEEMSNSSLMSTSFLCSNIPQVPITDGAALSVSAMSTSIASELSTNEIQQKLDNLLHENLQLKNTLHQNNLAMKKQFNTLVMWQEDVMKVHQSHKEKFEETKKLIAKLRAENTELKKSVSLSSSVNSSKEQSLDLQSKISVLEFELKTLQQANIHFKNDHSKIVHDLETKISELTKAKEEETSKLQAKIDALNAQLDSINLHNSTVEKKLEEASLKVPTAKELEEHDAIKKELKQLNSELILKRIILQEKTVLIDNLQEEISKLKIENETIPILKTQVDVYQADFNEERQARNNLKEEKDTIAQDLLHLHRRNQELLEEVENLRRSAGPQTSRQFTSREQTSSATQFICPVCGNNFRSLQFLDEHVDACIQNSA